MNIAFAGDFGTRLRLQVWRIKLCRHWRHNCLGPTTSSFLEEAARKKEDHVVGHTLSRTLSGADRQVPDTADSIRNCCSKLDEFSLQNALVVIQQYRLSRSSGITIGFIQECVAFLTCAVLYVVNRRPINPKRRSRPLPGGPLVNWLAGKPEPTTQ